MKLMERESSVLTPELLAFLMALACYRFAMTVTELMVFETGRRTDYYYVCPRCGITLEREFMGYCDRCGQHLEWKSYKKAKIVYPGRDRRGQ